MGLIFNKIELMENFKGDEDILIDLIDNFLEQKDKLLQSISDAITSKKATELKHAGHTLKGIISNFYSTELTAICADLEKRGEGNHFENIESLHIKLITSIDILCLEIQDLKTEISKSIN